MTIFSYNQYQSYLTDIEKTNSPKELFHQGDFNLINEGKRVSVVGSRNVSKEGATRTRILCKALVKKGITIVSGLAKGVDTVAHTTAIEENGKTIAVLGTPLDKVYPSENKQLLDCIKKEHLAVSQFPYGYPFKKSNFPMRNRTMALISDATIIVEATENSGTKHQGWEALRLGRSVFIMENLTRDSNLTWPKKMIEYGAQILTRENLDKVIDDIPYLTTRLDYAF